MADKKIKIANNSLFFLIDALKFINSAINKAKNSDDNFASLYKYGTSWYNIMTFF